jgi:hypothetical protein
MPEGNSPRYLWRSWLYRIRAAVRDSPFRPPSARVNIGVTRAMAREILAALDAGEKVVQTVDCAGRATERLAIDDGVMIEWLAEGNASYKPE